VGSLEAPPVANLDGLILGRAVEFEAPGGGSSAATQGRQAGERITGSHRRDLKARSRRPATVDARKAPQAGRHFPAPDLHIGDRDEVGQAPVDPGELGGVEGQLQIAKGERKDAAGEIHALPVGSEQGLRERAIVQVAGNPGSWIV
jgi:hypothetical protein